VNIEKYSRITDLISRFELTSLRENIGFTNMDPERTVSINAIPVYFSDNEIKVRDKTYLLTDGLLNVLTFPRSTADLTKEEARNYIDILERPSLVYEVALVDIETYYSFPNVSSNKKSFKIQY